MTSSNRKKPPKPISSFMSIVTKPPTSPEKENTKKLKKSQSQEQSLPVEIDMKGFTELEKVMDILDTSSK